MDSKMKTLDDWLEIGLEYRDIKSTETEICDLCGKTFSSRRELDRHKLSHIEERPHECEVCGQSFNTTFELKRHVFNLHIQSKTHNCEYCGEIFATKSSLSRHKSTHGATRESSHACKICLKRYKHKDDLQRHLLSAHMDNESIGHECSDCGKKFLTLKEVK